MRIQILAFARDFDKMRGVIVREPSSGLTTLVGEEEDWKFTPADTEWIPFWYVHAAVSKHGFEWLVQPEFDDAGLVRNALDIDHWELARFAAFLNDRKILKSLPSASPDLLIRDWLSREKDAATVTPTRPVTRRNESPRHRTETVSTGFLALDELTGGLEAGKSYMLYGEIGTGKTIFSLECLYQGLINGETVAIVTRRSAPTVFDQGHAFGMDLEAFARDGQLIVMEYNPHVIKNLMRLKEPAGITREFEFLLEGDRVQRLVFDPITPVLASPDPSVSIFRARGIFEHFSRQDATSLYLFDTPEGEEYLGNCKDFVYGVLRFEAGAFPGAGRLSLERFPSLRGRQAQLDFEVSPGVGMIELAAAAGAEGAGPRKVLIIEPEAAERETLRSVLNKNYNLLEADSAADGLAKIAADSPDLVILARDLKGMDGVEICRKLRQNKMNVPVILVSKQVRRAHDRVEMMSAGADECLERPLDGRILRLKVQNLLRRYEGQRDRSVAGPIESTVSSAIERDKTTSTNNLAYFYDRVRQEVNYANEHALSFAVLMMRVPPGEGSPQEVAGLAGALIREYDLVFTDKSGVAVLLAETDEKGVFAFLNRFKEKWIRKPAPQVEFKLYDRQEGYLQSVKAVFEGVRRDNESRAGEAKTNPFN